MTLAIARTGEDEVREKVLAYLEEEQRALPAETIIKAILSTSTGTYTFELVRRAIVNLLDEGRLVLTEARTVGLAA